MFNPQPPTSFYDVPALPMLSPANSLPYWLDDLFAPSATTPAHQDVPMIFYQDQHAPFCGLDFGPSTALADPTTVQVGGPHYDSRSSPSMLAAVEKWGPIMMPTPPPTPICSPVVTGNAFSTPRLSSSVHQDPMTADPAVIFGLQ
ncbi:hypothetical protein BC828DRAFT_387675 [Blastocladiella britannica]|nr:hypothetical protein BC828DRAFT_387675 [Blastocladiella britannica]